MRRMSPNRSFVVADICLTKTTLSLRNGWSIKALDTADVACLSSTSPFVSITQGMEYKI